MKKNLIYLSFVLGGMSLIMSGCAPELARTNYGPEEQQWKNHVQGCYGTWTPPSTPAPYSENNTTTSAVSSIDAIPAATESTLSQQDISHNTTMADTTLKLIPGAYTVKKGDSLWIISKRIYGDGRHWKKILDANKGKLSGSGSIKEGMVLTIPAK